MVYYHTAQGPPRPHSPAIPRLLPFRSSTPFILSTVAISLFTDLFLYGLIVPILPFLLRDRIALPPSKTQSYVSALLAAYAGASVLFSLPAGWIADRTESRQLPFLAGLGALLGGTVMLALGQSISVLVAARMLQGISAAVVWTVGFAMVLDTVGPANLGKVVGSLMSFISVGQLAAPVVGGVLYDRTGYVGVFGVGAGMLGLDFLMRVLVIEKKTAAKCLGPPDHNSHLDATAARDEEEQEQDPTEEFALLGPTKETNTYTIPPTQNRLLHTLPILSCLTSPRLQTALFLSFVEALLLSTFDATIPTFATSAFHFSSLQSGLLFIPLDIPYLFLGPLAGYAVDVYGPSPAAVVGFSWLTVSLALLRLPNSGITSSRNSTIILYCGLLALNGGGMAIIGAPAIVEASAVMRKYEIANPGFFGRNGPYAQLYGCNSLVFSAGLTVGPLVAGG